MSHQAFQCRLRVRYHETDQQGGVYHARYLEYLDVAMTEYFRHLGWDYRQLNVEGCDPSLVQTTLKFKRQAIFDEEILVSVWPVRIGNSSYTLCFEIESALVHDELLSAETIYVNFDTKTKRSRPIPASVRDRLARDLSDAPRA
jgi:acyl-CoA thioester hydrolase